MENFANMLVKSYIYCSLIDDKHIDLKGDLVDPPTDYEKLHHRTKKGEPCQDPIFYKKSMTISKSDKVVVLNRGMKKMSF